MRKILRLAVLILGGLVAPGLAAPPASPIADIVRDAAISDALDSFGSSVRDMARGGELSVNRMFLSHWEATAAEVFATTRLAPGLISSIDADLTAEDEASLLAFYASPLGKKVSRLERALHDVSTAEWRAALDSGREMLPALTPQRQRDFDRLMALGGPDIGAQLACQWLRVMLLGLSLAGQDGEIELPWADVDAQVAATTPGIVAEYRRNGRALAAYLYAPLTDSELSAYITVLDSTSMRRLYGASSSALDVLVQRAVKTFGAELAVRLRSVAI